MGLKLRIGHRQVGGLAYIFTTMYLFFSYTAQGTLLPDALSSFSLYGMIGAVAMEILYTRRVRLTGFTYWYLALMAWSGLSMVYAVRAETGTMYTMFVALVVTFCLIYQINSFQRLESWIRTLAYSGIIMCLMLAATGQMSGELEERLGEAVTGNANSFAALLALAAACAAWLLLYRAKRGEQILLLAGLGFIAYAMVLSGSRKAMIVIAITLFFMYALKDISRSLKMVRNLILGAAVIAAFWYAMMNVPVLYEAIGQRFEKLLSLIFEGEAQISSDVLRISMIRNAVARWKESPIWGYGLDTFKYYNWEALGRFYYAHNNYAELLYDLGIVGFLIYYGMMVRLTVRLWKLPKGLRDYKIFGLAIVLMMLVFDIGVVSFYGTFWMIMLSIGYSVVNIVGAGPGRRIGVRRREQE